MDQGNNYVLITGASQGLGRKIAIQMGRRKKNILLGSLKNERLSALAFEIKERFNAELKNETGETAH